MMGLWPRLVLAIGTFAPAGDRHPIPSEWVHWDPVTKTASITLVAAQEPRNGGWNFNGLTSGEATVTIPLGAKVVVELTNRDSNLHSVGLVEITPIVPSSGDAAKPAFQGSFTVPFVQGMPRGKSDRFTFTASRAGRFWLLCGVAPHGVGGMWLYLTIVKGAKAASVRVTRAR
ncbi:MAG: sulfocyanin-like copper-binding protein [Gemmatimonadota bacterium]